MFLTPEQRTSRATELFGVALALAIVDAGWVLHMKPGEHYYECGSERISARRLMNDLVSKKMAKDEWVQRCQKLNIAGVRLSGLVDSLKEQHRQSGLLARGPRN